MSIPALLVLPRGCGVLLDLPHQRGDLLFPLADLFLKLAYFAVSRRGPAGCNTNSVPLLIRASLLL